MPRSSSARQDYLAAARRLLRRQGYAATGLGEIIGTSGAPKGSFYHFFPGGKEQLAGEALDEAALEVKRALDAVRRQSSGPAELVVRFAALEAAQMQRSEFEDGCPVATVVLEMATRSEVIRQSTGSALRSWASVLGVSIEEAGIHEPESVAAWVLANLEGALILARAWHDATVITKCAGYLAEALERMEADPFRGGSGLQRSAPRRRRRG